MADHAVPQHPQSNLRPDFSVFEHKPRGWDHYQPPGRQQAPPTYPHVGHYQPREIFIKHSAILAEDQSNSDVSDTPGYDRRGTRPKSPKSVSKLPGTFNLETVDALEAHLREVESADSFNNEQHSLLRAKRARKDARIHQRRAVEDEQINLLYEARRRHDNRIQARRAREDDHFNRAFSEMDREDSTTRNRLKRLKRGLPMDDPNEHARTLSMASSVSPTSTALPPAKRHQAAPPDAGHHRPPPVNGVSSTASNEHAASHPSYHFYQATPAPYPVPFHSNYGHHPPPAVQPIPSQTSAPPSSAVVTPSSAPRSSHGSHEVLPTINGTNASHNGPPGHSQVHGGSPADPASQAAGKEYNTRPPDSRPLTQADARPPPQALSGFASINMPATSGFAAINPRASGQNLTLSVQQATGAKPIFESPIQPDGAQSNRASRDSGTPVNTPTAGKRTPSTTHPYSQSEAFANRHHHCERTDQLGRGIWTSHGPGGTHESPTGPPVEMYLRCNHDNCRRIDWRTVHGLQCHIVKSHEQPKGTIGSLEKALDRYGVPIKEVEEHENEYGFGSGGTMADPKNLKIKNKMRETQSKDPLAGARRSDQGLHSMSASPPSGLSPSVSNGGGVRSIGFRPGTEPLGGSHMFPGRYSSDNVRQLHEHHASEDEADEQTQKPAAFLMKPWNGPNDLQSVSALNKDQRKPRPEEDHEMPDVPAAEPAKSSNAVEQPSDVQPMDGVENQEVEAQPNGIKGVIDAEAAPDIASKDVEPATTAEEVSTAAPAADKQLQGIEASEEQTEEPARGTLPLEEKEEKAESPLPEPEAKVAEPEKLPQPAKPAPITSPRAMRKPASRRASLAHSKAQEELHASEEEVPKEEATKEDPENRDDDGDGGTIVAQSPRTRNKENPQAGGRPRRQGTGRFRKSRG